MIVMQSARFALLSLVAHLEEVLLPARAGVRVEVPFDIAVLILKRAATNFERSKTHARSYLAELAGVIGSPDEDVVPDLDNIIHVLEGDDSAALRLAFGSWKRGEEVLENLYNPLADWRGEALS